ncbi:hypothetical protein BH11MYX1_BH11MYX1_06840 [soil metagenome]
MFHRFAYLAVVLSACASAAVAPAPDSTPVSTIPTVLTGTYDVVGELDLATLPAPAIELLAELSTATDTPDDPARYLVDRMVAALPDGTVKLIARGLSGFVASYVELELDKIAPNFAPGIRALSAGLNAVGHHVTTIERLIIASDGIMTRSLIGLQLANTPVELAAAGAPDELSITRAAIDGEGTVAIASHKLALPYGEMLRLGLDRAVIPPIDLAAGNLADALRDLVDCHQLGITVAAHAPIGSAGMYETACSVAMTSLASGIYARLAAIDAAPFELYVSGTSTGVDRDGDGTMDEIRNGVWAGTTTYAGAKGPIGTATFSGVKE